MSDASLQARSMHVVEVMRKVAWFREHIGTGGSLSHADSAALLRYAQRLGELATIEGLRVAALEWQADTFPQRTPHSIATHLLREATELQQSPDDPSEIADVFLLLIALANEVGVDLARAVNAKLALNKARTWGTPDAHGVVEHVKEASDA